MSKILLITHITFKDTIRNKGLHGILFAGLALFLVNIGISGFFNWELGKVTVDVSLSIISLAGLLFIFFLGIQILGADISNKNIYFILSKPVARWQYIIGKYLGLCAIVFISSLFLGACSWLSITLVMHNYPSASPLNFSWPTFFLSWCFINLTLFIVMALSFFWVLVTTHPYTAMLFSSGTYFIGNMLETTKYLILNDPNFENNPFLVWVLHGVTWIFPNLKAFDLKTTAAYGLHVDYMYCLMIAIYGISYIGLILLISTYIFNKKEIG
ncbi:ABC transporter permease [Desulfogranum japonicum]|uniref:ABC transporter permease n=1 Tax=Desulfogranum japonicum TaxID=231447 RepID=UPI000429B528|nr:ABC transporter permease subunit [Desulfogranum japonicum]